MYSLTLEDWIAILEYLSYSFMAICFCLGVIAGSFR